MDLSGWTDAGLEDGCVDELTEWWMNGWLCVWIDGWANGLVDILMDRLLDELLDACMNGWMHPCIYARTNEWMNCEFEGGSKVWTMEAWTNRRKEGGITDVGREGSMIRWTYM